MGSFRSVQSCELRSAGTRGGNRKLRSDYEYEVPDGRFGIVEADAVRAEVQVLALYFVY